MSKVKIYFTNWQSFGNCPVWWRNFVLTVCAGMSGLSYDAKRREKALVDGLAVYNGAMIPEESYDQEIDYIEFETEEDYLAFRLKWM